MARKEAAKKPTATKPTATKPAAGKALATRKDQLPASKYGDDLGMGLEDVKSNETLIPFFKILGDQSPQVVDKTIKNAKPGMFVNIATNEIFDGETKGIDFLVVARDHNFVEQTPIDEGGGFVGIRSPDDPLVAKLRAEQGEYTVLKTKDDTEIQETFYLYAVLLPSRAKVMIGYKGTQIKKYKALITRALQLTVETEAGPRTAPFWMHIWHATTQREKNKKGKYWGWNIGLQNEDPLKCRLEPDDELYQYAREFALSIKAGKVKVNYEQATETEHEADEESM